jgi:hypothetical protein
MKCFMKSQARSKMTGNGIINIPPSLSNEKKKD